MAGSASFFARAVRHVVWRVERAATLTVDRFRRGDRSVIMTPVAGLRFGNWLYLWLVAHAHSAAGQPTLVLEVEGMRPWLERFPALARLTAAPEQVRFHDRREWEGDYRYQRFGTDFSREELQAFVRNALAADIPLDASDRVVINIRRGDYYEGGFAERYGFDLEGYVAEALRRVPPSSDALVVSDDPEWCRANLDRVIRRAGLDAGYAERDPIGNFIAVSAGRRLIGTNSTFSYWGGYIADALHPDAVVVMPRFHARMEGGSDAFQLDPKWVVVDGFH